MLADSFEKHSNYLLIKRLWANQILTAEVEEKKKKKALYQLPLKLSCSRQLGLTGLENEMESTLLY